MDRHDGKALTNKPSPAMGEGRSTPGPRATGKKTGNEGGSGMESRPEKHGRSGTVPPLRPPS